MSDEPQPASTMDVLFDRLAFMLDAQRELQLTSFDISNFREMSTQKRIDYIRMNVLALTDELHEILNEMSWKPWTRGDPWINEDLAFKEFVDAWHFMMNILLAILHTSDPETISYTLQHAYMEKRGVNVKRRENDYDGRSTKCASCKRAFDDPSQRYDQQEDHVVITCHCGDVTKLTNEQFVRLFES